MRICIGGRNNIAVDVCKYLLTILPKESIFAIPGLNDNGEDYYQRSFLKYVNKEGIRLVTLQDVYEWDDLIFLSLEFDRIIRPHKFKSNKLFNIHFSLLPAYKGVFTSALPILRGEQYGGVTFHYMDLGIDTGDIIDQVKFDIPEDYKAIDLYLRCIDEGTKLVIKNINDILIGKIKSQPQSKRGSTYFSTDSIDYSNLSINFKTTADQIDCQIRAFSYRPFQLCKVEGSPIFYAEITNDKSTSKPGTIIENNAEYIRVASIDYDILLFKDRLDEVMECAKNNDLDGLLNITHLYKYIDEKEKVHGWTPLIVAAYHNSYDVVRFLVEHGANINSTNYNGTTVIMYAKNGSTSNGGFKSLDFLLENGADPNIKDYMDKNLFDYIDESMPVWEHVIRYRNNETKCKIITESEEVK